MSIIFFTESFLPLLISEYWMRLLWIAVARNMIAATTAANAMTHIAMAEIG